MAGDAAQGPAAGATAPATIVCVDCGGTCHLLTTPFEDGHGRVGFRPGDIVSYRCADCLDRWDIELDESDLA
ncbi:MAG: hypothetical protein JST64_15515 [Actinobacteria bacterium]|nr:hypothetical protein [Actinomycetota bacterium]